LAPRKLKFDVAVVGGGTAGIAAATTASREGARCCLIERYGFAGGQAVSAEVGTLCGFFSTGSGLEGLAGSFAEEVLQNYRELAPGEKVIHPAGLCYLPYAPAVLERVLVDFLEDAGVTSFFHSTATSINFSDGELGLLVGNKLAVVEASQWIDASGETTLSLLAGLPVLEEKDYQAPGYVFRCENVDIEKLAGQEHSERFAGMSLMRSLGLLYKSGLLTATGNLSVVPGSMTAHSLNLKFSYPHVRSGEFNDAGEIEKYGRKAIFEIFRVLKSSCEGFEQAELGHIAAQAGFRAGAKGLGYHILSEKEVLGAVKQKEAIANGLWPVEYWDGGAKPELEFFSKDDYFQIPLGSIRSRHQENLFFAGRCLSADARAHSAARVIGTSLATGAAAGRIAGLIAEGRSLSDSLEIHQRKEGLIVEEVREVFNAG